MAKSIKSTTKIGGGGEKIDTKKAIAAQKLYWEVLVGKKKITSANCPESISFDLHKLKAYLNEVEAEFNRLNIPYGERSVSVLPIAHNEKDKFSVLFTPSVVQDTGKYLHQFNKPPKAKKSSKHLMVSNEPNYDFQLNAANGGSDWP
jgi:hypothetical protein